VKNVPQSQQFTIKQAISRAKKATKQGNTTVAMQIYNAILQHQPNNPVAKKGLRKLQKGLAHDQSVQVETANPSQDQINALVNLYHSGQMTNTEQGCRELLETYPQSLVIINILGAALQGQGKLQEAVESYEKAIHLKPDYAEAYNNRGFALQDLGQPAKAVESCEKAIHLKPGYAEAYNNRGVSLKDLGQLEEAVESCDKAIQFKPDYAEAYSNLGVALQALGRMEKAVESYEKAIQLKPDYADAYNNLGNAFRDLGQLEMAMESYEKAIQLMPDFEEVYSNRGNALRDLGQLEKAVESYEKAIQLKPDYADAYNNLGNALRDLGQLEKAVESCKKAIRLKPDFAEAHLNLSRIKKYKPDDPQIALMESLYAEVKLNKSDRKYLSFALAKAYGDLGEYDKNFDYLVEGNRLRKKELNYNIDDDRKLINKIRQIFSAGSISPGIVSERNKSIQSIFILGMPRSGTSLVEQIIASHTKVYGAGELATMNKLVSAILSNVSVQNNTQGESKISQNEISTLRDGYLDALSALRVPEKIITDKMPLNFQWIGFILSAFPDAKIIHLNRDPRATCWSIYKHYFSSMGNGYAYDLIDLAEFYKLYIDLMSFWREKFPNSIYDLCYEDLTENQEEETRKLLTFCDLEWEEQCLDFHKTKRVVKTESAAQVRKKMYKGSSEAWRKYEKHLQPLIKALGF